MIRAYDDNGNVVDLVEHDKQIYNKALSDVEYMLNNIEINIDKDTVMDFYRKALDKLQMLGELKEGKNDN